jgi:hypothetical protein
MMLISVVLPAPFGPSRPKEFALRDVEIDARQRLQAAVALFLRCGSRSRNPWAQ